MRAFVTCGWLGVGSVSVLAECNGVGGACGSGSSAIRAICAEGSRDCGGVGMVERVRSGEIIISPTGKICWHICGRS